MLKLPYPKRVIERLKKLREGVHWRALDGVALEHTGMSGSYMQGVADGIMKEPSNRSAMNLGCWPVYLDLETGEIVAVPIQGCPDLPDRIEFQDLITEDTVITKIDVEELRARLRKHQK